MCPLPRFNPVPWHLSHSTQSYAFSFHGRVDVVICLSTTVRNDTLQEVKEHRVSLKCRKQLRVEELEMVMLPETAGPVLSCRETGTGRWLIN